MSDYTPTTDEVRKALVEWFRWDYIDPGKSVDRWLAAVERAAAEKALERVRSTIGAYQEHGVWAFDQAVKSIERTRAEKCRREETE